MKLPSYPIITVDPFFSIWSKSDEINKGETFLWCGEKKKLKGVLNLDGKELRFLGVGKEDIIPQRDAHINPYSAEYIFENESIRLTFRTWTPFLLDDLTLFSTPVAFLEADITVLDGNSHRLEVSIEENENLCYSKKKPVTKYISAFYNMPYGRMGLSKQSPLSFSADGKGADWGYHLITGEKVSAHKNGITAFFSKETNSEALFSFISAFDDIYSIEFFGEKLKGLWTERFSSIEEAMLYCKDNRDYLYSRLKKQEEMILSDGKDFSEDYRKILCACSRQILAGHKLVRNESGELLYLSKECHSNGCINTVDVSYPAIPFFLLYAPELVKAMCTGIFRFASLPLWNVDFAPHDIGRYPIANGQVYSLKRSVSALGDFAFKKLYKAKSFTSVYSFDSQMPVEECGNMLIISYAYYLFSKDKDFLSENFSHLSSWAAYLKEKDIDLENQLCTDDFAGRSKSNVNLAIKGIIGLCCFDKICSALGIASIYGKTAKSNALRLVEFSKKEDGTLPFSLDKEESWSLKYNLVWDKIFGFGLFEDNIYKAESELYKSKLNKYGVPLDYRKDFTKSDWMLWAAALDDSKESTNLFSAALVNFLSDTKDKVCFSDWFDTKTARQMSFDHRTVQGGLWMPILKKKLLEKSE